jgi:hypothetical protein
LEPRPLRRTPMRLFMKKKLNTHARGGQMRQSVIGKRGEGT